MEYRNNCSKTSEILWEYCRDEPAFGDDVDIVSFGNENTTDSFHLKVRLTSQTEAAGTKI